MFIVLLYRVIVATVNIEDQSVVSKLFLRLTGSLGDTGDRNLKIDDANNVRYIEYVNLFSL